MAANETSHLDQADASTDSDVLLLQTHAPRRGARFAAALVIVIACAGMYLLRLPQVPQVPDQHGGDLDAALQLKDASTSSATCGKTCTPGWTNAVVGGTAAASTCSANPNTLPASPPEACWESTSTSHSNAFDISIVNFDPSTLSGSMKAYVVYSSIAMDCGVMPFTQNNALLEADFTDCLKPMNDAHGFTLQATVASVQLCSEDSSIEVKMNLVIHGRDEGDFPILLSKVACETRSPTAAPTAAVAPTVSPTSPANLMCEGTCVCDEASMTCVAKETSTSGACFPGDASVTVETRGRVEMVDLRVGDRVLVSRRSLLEFEPVLAFLHAVRGEVDFVSIHHSAGTLRASRNHIVLTPDGDRPVVDLKAGDRLIIEADGSPQTSRVVSVRLEDGVADAYAPLTSSGTIVVDGVLASNYALPHALQLTHALMHTFLFPVRAYHACGLASMLAPLWRGGGVDSSKASDELHPYLELTYRCLRFDTLCGFLGCKSRFN